MKQQLTPRQLKVYSQILKFKDKYDSIGEVCQAAKIPRTTWYAVRAQMRNVDPKRLEADFGPLPTRTLKNEPEAQKRPYKRRTPSVIDIPVAPSSLDSKVAVIVGSPSDVVAALTEFLR